MRAIHRQVLFTSGQNGYHTYRIPALLRAAPGTLLAFCEARRNSPDDHGKIDLVMRRSDDDGVTWSDIRLVYGEDGATTIGNPVPILDAQTGRVHLLFCRNNTEGIFHIASDDHGESWSTPRLVCDADRLSAGFGLPVVRYGTGPCHGLQLPPGCLVAPVWSKADASHSYLSGKFVGGVLYSLDRGHTWLVGARGADGSNESALALLPDGTILMNSRSMAQPAGYRVVGRTRDITGGTFASACDEQLLCPNCQGSICTDDAGTLWFCNPAVRNAEISYRGDLRHHLTLQGSTDGGLTWSSRVLLEAGPSGYSDVQPLSDHRLGVLFECGSTDYRERIDFLVVETQGAAL